MIYKEVVCSKVVKDTSTLIYGTILVPLCLSGLANEYPGIFFKDTILRNYFFRKVNWFNFQYIKCTMFYKNLLLKGFKECPGILISIFFVTFYSEKSWY
jgi:hypothetical protein